ncbi:hypothetical protein GCM10011380_29640 [Sphingomonas metalli]|uniref:Energy transducer TonB n=1 Tax=Sphingomonas metalli TaxID=1779358 RepID=A0A916TCF4_9SPHN|nr:energy transducer TonB [Sphingomonas metalli]GGB38308.1 hypothetical protein GCM10011380_29640 [Sphingomonas metalli]
MYGEHIPRRERLGSAALTALLTVAVGWALVSGLAMRGTGGAEESLATFDVTVPPPPPAPRVVPERRHVSRPEGRAAPAGLRSQATEIVAPPVPAIVPPPVVAAPVAGIGRAATQGAAVRPGPGPGAGGLGDGRGAGGDGDGDGGGWGAETEPHYLKGYLTFQDGADVIGEAVIGRSISVKCILLVNTRLTECEATRSTGYPALDARILKLVEKRFRYAPWRDGRGRPVESTVLVDYAWTEEE